VCCIIQTYFNGIMQLLLPVSLLAKSSCSKYQAGKQYDQIFQQEIFSKITRLLLVEIFKTCFLPPWLVSSPAILT